MENGTAALGHNIESYFQFRCDVICWWVGWYFIIPSNNTMQWKGRNIFMFEGQRIVISWIWMDVENGRIIVLRFEMEMVNGSHFLDKYLN